jgi:L-asparagine transporter-like permease
MSVPQFSSAEATPKHGAALRQRHVTMIAPGGIIGAGLFVGCSATLATVGPAACVSYLVAGIAVLMVMRMLGEMALASIAYLTAERQALPQTDYSSAIGYLSPIGQQAIEGRK